MSNQTRKHLISLVQREYRNTVRLLKRRYDARDPLLRVALDNAKSSYRYSKNAIEHADLACVSHMLSHSRNYRVYQHTH